MSFPLRSTVVVVAAACAAFGAYAASSVSSGPASGPAPKVMGGAPQASGVMSSSRLTTVPTITQMIVKYKSESASAHAQGLSSTRMSTLAAHTGMKFTYRRPMSGMAHVLRLPKAMTAAEAQLVAAQIAQDPNVAYAEPDYIRRPSLVPNDPFYTLVTFGTSGSGRQGQWHFYAPTDNYTYRPVGGVSTTIKATGGADLPAAWDITRGSGVVVAVVDTGITAHSELNANLVGGAVASSGYDFISGNAYSGATDPNPAYFTANDGDGRDSNPADAGDWVTTGQCGDGDPSKDQNSSWHGTHVAGTIAAKTDNLSGVAGIADGSTVLVARALGKCGGLNSDIADAVTWAAGGTVVGVPANTHPAKVINLSLGGSTADGPDVCGNAEQAAVNAVRALGAVVVAATGNDGTANISAPASCAGVIAVTAHTVEGDNADYANVGTSGDSATAPTNSTTISAPGGGCGTTLSATCANQYVWSTSNSGTQSPSTEGYAGAAGTSMATPHVSGVAVLIKSVQAAATPDYTRLILQGTAREFPAGTYCQTTAGRGKCGAGMLDAKAAVERAQAGGPAVFAGLPQIVMPGATVTLHGEALPLVNGTPLSYTWTVLSGNATLSSYTTTNPTFTASASGEIKLQLTANDGTHATTSTTSVYVESAPTITGYSGVLTVSAGSTVTFTVSGNDVDGDAVNFVMDSGPTGATFTGGGIFTWPNAGPAGTYPVVVRAYDGALYSAPITVNVVVTAASGGSTGGGGGGGGAVGWLGLALLALGAFGLRRNRALR